VEKGGTAMHGENVRAAAKEHAFRSELGRSPKPAAEFREEIQKTEFSSLQKERKRERNSCVAHRQATQQELTYTPQKQRGITQIFFGLGLV
jgi:hypothetical protein